MELAHTEKNAKSFMSVGPVLRQGNLESSIWLRLMTPHQAEVPNEAKGAVSIAVAMAVAVTVAVAVATARRLIVGTLGGLQQTLSRFTNSEGIGQIQLRKL